MHRGLWPSGFDRVKFFASASWVQVSACTSITSTMSYLSTGFAGYSVGPEINHGARKLVRTPRVIKKIVQYQYHT
jgi:hypothetical protein